MLRFTTNPPRMPSVPDNPPTLKTTDEIVAECEQLIAELHEQAQKENADLRQLYLNARLRLTEHCKSLNLDNDPLAREAMNVLNRCEDARKKFVITDYYDHQYLTEIILRTQIGLLKPERQENLNKLMTVTNKVDGNRSKNEILKGAVAIFIGIALIAVTYMLAAGTFGVAPLAGIGVLAILGKVFGYGVGGALAGLGLSVCKNGYKNKREYGLIQSCSLFQNQAKTAAEVSSFHLTPKVS